MAQHGCPTCIPSAAYINWQQYWVISASWQSSLSIVTSPFVLAAVGSVQSLKLCTRTTTGVPSWQFDIAVSSACALLVLLLLVLHCQLQRELGAAAAGALAVAQVQHEQQMLAAKQEQQQLLQEARQQVEQLQQQLRELQEHVLQQVCTLAACAV